MPEENPAIASASAADTSVASGFTGMFNAFVDPAGLAKRVSAKLFWVWPIITVCIIYIVFSYLMLPYTMQLIDAKMSERMSQQGLPAERMETAKNMAHMFSYVGLAVTPIFVIGILALMAWLVTITGSMVSLRAKFRDVFSVMAACSLITALQVPATYVVLRSKGDEITSQEQMMVPFGLDIFMQGAHGPLLALVNFFSIFEIWYLVMLGLALAALAGSSKGKAFFAITPAWFIPLIFKIVGSLFSNVGG